MAKSSLSEILNSKRKSQELEAICNSLDLVSQVLAYAIDSEDTELFQQFYLGYLGIVSRFETFTGIGYVNCEIESFVKNHSILPFA